MNTPAWLTRTSVAAAIGGVVVAAALGAPLLLRPADAAADQRRVEAAVVDQRRVAFEATLASCLKLDEQIGKASTTAGATHLKGQATALDCKAVRKAARR